MTGLPTTLFTESDLPALRPRGAESHKGVYGKVLVVAGAVGYTGAAALTAMACLRAGAGVVTLATPEAVYGILAVKLTEVIVRPLPDNDEGCLASGAYEPLKKMSDEVDLIAIGPGLSQNEETQKLVIGFLSRVSPQMPLVVDADGLNILAKNKGALKCCAGRSILTPHPGEMVRLSSLLPEVVRDQRERVCHDFARRYQVVCALKGHHTVVAEPNQRVYVNHTGNPGMATAGSGDVLTGVIAALLGQGHGLFEAAALGVHLHGLAGDLAARRVGEDGLVAGDILDAIPHAFLQYRRARPAPAAAPPPTTATATARPGGDAGS